MTWVRFDDQFPIHRKVRGLSDGAYRLHSEAIFWCSRNTTDGFVGTEDVSELATARRPHKYLPELEARGIWHRSDQACHSDSCPGSQADRPTETGWFLHDYFDYQPTKAKVEADRKAKAARQAKWLAGKRRGKDASQDASTQGRDASTDASQDASIDGNPAPPRPEGSGGGSPRQRQAVASAPRNGARDDQRAELRQLAIANCQLCDNRGYAGTRVCDHDPAAAERAARGRALVRDALGAKT